MTERYQELCAVAGPVSRETFDRLQQFEIFFLKWAAGINLASASTLEHVWTRHILDSAQLNAIAPGSPRWLDIGSGGGFPGLVMAILLSERDGASVDLVEPNHKKAGFLRAAVGSLGVPARVHSRRIAQLEGTIAQPDVITARAVAPLDALLEMASFWLSRGATALFHKGRDYRKEVAESLNSWRFDLIEHTSRIDAAGVVLEIGNCRRLDAQDELSGRRA